MNNYFIFYALTLIAEILGTVSGFGSSILFVPLASIFLDFKLVLGVTAVFHVFSNLSKIFLFRNGIDRTVALKLGIPAVIFVVLGALLTGLLPTALVELCMNIVLLALAIFLLRHTNQTLDRTDANLYGGGALSGFLAGLVGTGGAIRGLTLAAFNLEKDIFIATSALIDLGVDFSRAVVYIWQGYFRAEHLVMVPFLIIVSLLGSWLGKLALQKISQRNFKYIVLGVILLTTLIQLAKYLNQLRG